MTLSKTFFHNAPVYFNFCKDFTIYEYEINKLFCNTDWLNNNKPTL